MALTFPSLKITFGGALPGSERWQCGLLATLIDVTISQAQLQAIADSAATSIKAWYDNAGVGGLQSGGSGLDTVTVYQYDVGGTTAKAVARGTFTPSVASGTQTAPNQCALVVTLLTLDPSRRGRGRIYVPATKPGLSGPQVPATTAQALATTTGTLLTALNGITAVGSVVGGTSGFPVNSVRVDTIVDTQRRRANKLQATSRPTAPVTV